ncbi:uncharacterized protein BJX67DRAFT_279019 [Aspergillus lucknowensis]|uniref:F-box domain-containing protein n=1 Tax=Aspergillus lucknowensis TaxID=176173 RepID=A0ABR4M0K4_9EURO
MAQVGLPPELILRIVECVIPSSPPVAFPPRHVVTRTLLSFTLVCKLTSRVAKQLLMKHCLYIVYGDRLGELLLHTGPLSIFRGQSRRPPSGVGLFLSPFPPRYLNSPCIAWQVHHLASIICGSLTRLVIDMPLRELYPEHDVCQVRPVLRQAFARMTMLEEFCSVRDELYLSTIPRIQEPAIWSFWPRLKRLALYNVDIDSSQFIEGLRQCSNLTHLVLVRPDGLATELSAEQIGSAFLPALQCLVIVVSMDAFLYSPLVNYQRWEESFVGRLHFLRNPVEEESRESDSESGPWSMASYLSIRVPSEREIEECQQWLADQALSGKLWRICEDQHNRQAMRSFRPANGRSGSSQ